MKKELKKIVKSGYVPSILYSPLNPKKHKWRGEIYREGQGLYRHFTSKSMEKVAKKMYRYVKSKQKREKI